MSATAKDDDGRPDSAIRALVVCAKATEERFRECERAYTEAALARTIAGRHLAEALGLPRALRATWDSVGERLTLSDDAFDAVAGLDGAEVSRWYARSNGHSEQRTATAVVCGVPVVAHEVRERAGVRP